MGLPTQDKCDMGKADEHFLWALLNIGDSIGAPLLVPEPILREWSKHLYLAGFRHCDDEQRIWYEVPQDGVSVFDGAAGGRWVDHPPEGDDMQRVVDSMSDEDREALRMALNNGVDS